MKTIKAWIRIAVISSVVLLAAACGGGGGDSGGGGGGGGGGGNNVTVPNVVGMTQAAASSAITGAGLTVGTVSMASSSSVASGNVISEDPAAGASVASGSAVNLTVSSGPAQVAVPNVVGNTQAAATTAITGAGLKVGTVTMTSSNSVTAGNVISEDPVAGTMVASGSAVNLTVSSGPPPGKHYAYVANASDATISAFSLDAATGTLTSLGAAIPVTGASALQEIKIDPSNKYVYVISQGDDNVYGFSINADGSLTAIAGSPFGTGIKPQSMAFDSTGAFLYVLNVTGNNLKQSSISVFSVAAATGALTSLSTPKITNVNAGSIPAQIVTVKNFLYVALQTAGAVDLFTINADGSLTETTDNNSPWVADTGTYSLAVDPAGTVLYTANAGTSGSISSFKINADGTLTPFCATAIPSCLQIPAYGDIGIDPQGKYLFVTEQTAGKGYVDVYPINAAGATGLDPAVANSPFATGGQKPNAVSFDASGKWVFSGNDFTANFAEFSLNAATGALTPVVASPIASGNNPDFIAVN